MRGRRSKRAHSFQEIREKQVTDILDPPDCGASIEVR